MHGHLLVDRLLPELFVAANDGLSQIQLALSLIENAGTGAFKLQVRHSDRTGEIVMRSSLR